MLSMDSMHVFVYTQQNSQSGEYYEVQEYIYNHVIAIIENQRYVFHHTTK